MEYAHPDEPDKRYFLGQKHARLPDGRVCLTPLDEFTAIDAGLLPVETVTVTPSDNEVMLEKVTTVEANRIVDTQRKRLKNTQELVDVDIAKLRDAVVDLAILQIRVIDELLVATSLPIKTANISVRARQAYQDIKAIVNRVAPNA